MTIAYTNIERAGQDRGGPINPRYQNVVRQDITGRTDAMWTVDMMLKRERNQIRGTLSSSADLNDGHKTKKDRHPRTY